MNSFTSGPFYPSGFNFDLLLGVTFRTGGRARRLARLFHLPMTSPATAVKGLFCVNLGVLGVAFHALLDIFAFLPRVMAGLAILKRVRMLFVGELNPLILIPYVMLGILDSDRIRLTKDALQDEQGSKEQNCSNNGNEFSVHQPLTSFLPIPFFAKLGQIIPNTNPLSRKK
jgi:hypothetical protein